ncbi:hypothetical protein CR513_32559, partial [Mucuna pruriens]
MEMSIFEKYKLGYIINDYPQPTSSNLIFRQWRTENAIPNKYETPFLLHTLMDLKHVNNTKQAGGLTKLYYNTLQ